MNSYKIVNYLFLLALCLSFVSCQLPKNTKSPKNSKSPKATKNPKVKKDSKTKNPSKNSKKAKKSKSAPALTYTSYYTSCTIPGPFGTGDCPLPDYFCNGVSGLYCMKMCLSDSECSEFGPGYICLGGGCGLDCSPASGVTCPGTTACINMGMPGEDVCA